MTTLVYELERRGGRYGLQAICEGGGTGKLKLATPGILFVTILVFRQRNDY